MTASFCHQIFFFNKWTEKMFYVLFVCKCVLYQCHRVFTKLQLTNISISINISDFPSNPCMYFRFSMRTTCPIQLIFLYLITLRKGKGRSKFQLITTHEGPEEVQLQLYPFCLTSGLYGVGGQRRPTAPLPPKRPDIRYT